MIANQHWNLVREMDNSKIQKWLKKIPQSFSQWFNQWIVDIIGPIRMEGIPMSQGSFAD